VAQELYAKCRFKIFVFFVNMLAMENNYDIAIIGGGLAGCSMAIALREQAFKIALLEKQDIKPKSFPVDTLSRPLSLNYASYKILKTLDVWQKLADVACAIEKVHVSEEGRFGALQFAAGDYKVPALGYVIPATALQTILQEHALTSNGVDYIQIEEVNALSRSEHGICLAYKKQQQTHKIQAKLLIAADGADSPSRELLQKAVKKTDLKQIAFTALIETDRFHNHTAYERITPQGVIALLPLAQPNHYGLVWTAANQQAQAMQQWDVQAWSQALSKHMRQRIGNIQNIVITANHPLQTAQMQQTIDQNVVFIGNAAHTLSPVAAQGFNLVLREVAHLSESLAIAGLEDLKTFDETFRPYVSGMTGVTQFIHEIASFNAPGFSWLRSKSLFAMEFMPLLKKKMAYRLMGLAGKLPKLLRGVAL
jgi:2-octaprenyl-6-methoxyphenol hydroxylase